MMSGSPASSTSILVTAPWLRDNLGRVKVLDCSWHLPTANRSAKHEFARAHIPGARFFDIDTIKDLTRPDLPHMLPQPAFFASAMDKFGIANHDHVVVYDSAGVGPACRVFWTFHAMGHNNVSVLDGGLPAWTAQGGETEAGPETAETSYTTQSYVAHPDQRIVCNYADVIGAIEELKASAGAHGRQIIDARPHARFTGAAPEFRPGLSSGHMPMALSVPSSEMTVATDASPAVLKRPADIRATFEAAGVDLKRPIIASCGSGVTAAVLYFALLNAGVDRSALTLFDGSWTEYALNPHSEIIIDTPTKSNSN
ncbi:hypothetical protein LPJ66_003374 [Kickxella alabastrina]|uniref:Uncharacterized protein n=1 Tax=Kickxella alabastrina TaxID=61397 RepID=A0ACC1IKA2_9FUNG|nr:hypothetical protein LPJ66_003374 [Kickxella alabastrina]